MPAPKGHPPYPGCETGGRPKIWTDERIEEEAEALLQWLEEKPNFLFMEFCYARKIGEEWPSRWAKKNDKFMQAYKQARLKQQIVAIKNGLFKKFDSGLTRWFLACNYKWKEGTDTSGLDEETSTPGSRGLADVKRTCIEHTDALEQASDKSS